MRQPRPANQADRTWTPNHVSASRDRDLLPWLDWRFSLIMPLGILLLAITAIVQISTEEEYLEVVVTDQPTGEAIGGAFVAIGDDVYAADDDGRVRIVRPDSDTTIRVTMPGYQAVSGPFGSDNSSVQNVPLFPESASTSSAAYGRVLDITGKPLRGAIVQTDSGPTISGSDGIFKLDRTSSRTTLHVSAKGYIGRSVDLELANFEDIRLSEVSIKAVYADALMLGTDGEIDRQIDIANTTEINALVIDIKEDTIFYDSQVEFFVDAGTVEPIFDASALLKKLKANDIYTIARIVVFQDPLVAEVRPDLAVLDSTTGDLWRNQNGVAWVSAFNTELWDANIDLATEALDLGFDEIQYDYVRFPSDGDLSTANFGREYTADARETAITGFMQQSYEAIHAKGGKLAADLFGYVTIVDDEQYIGQRFSALEPYLDVVCMMIYPSHFEEGNIASAAGHPNDFPYETIYESLERAELNIPGSASKFRPWLQDFTYYGMREYTAVDVRLQIDAAEDFGTAGWMLWGDPMNVSVEALKPQE
ncbi:MAG: putative glycoside hydrolase [Thermomicrobiales bacterium]